MTAPWLRAALLYLLLALFLLYPAWTDPAHGVVGDWTHPDALGNHWLYRWMEDVVWGGASILHNDRYYVPVGDAPWLAGNGSDALYYAVLLAWLPWPFSVTAWCLLTLVANGLGGRALGRVAGAGDTGATLAGAALVLCPYVTREMAAGRFAQASLGACAFFLAAWWRHLDAPTLGRGVLAGGLFGLAAFGYWYHGLWMALAGAILWTARPSAAALVRFLPAALLTTLPPLAVFLGNWGAIPGTGEATFPHPLAVEYALPATFPVWTGTGALRSLALPIWVWGLAAAGAAAVAPRWRWASLGAAAVFYLLCLGPEWLGVDGSSTGAPAPYAALYRWSDPLRRFWWPYRHLAPLTLVLLPLVAHGADRAARWLAVPGAAVGLLGLLPLELWARGAVVEGSSSWWTPPAAYEALRERPEGAVVELPLAQAFARTESSITYQWAHGKPLVNGHAMWVERVRPVEWEAWLAEQPLLDALHRFERGELSGPWSLPEGATPAPEGVRWVTVSREYFPGELSALADQHARLLTAWFGAPVIRAGGVRVWDLAAWTGERHWTFATWTPPADYVSAEGLASLPATVRAPGWRHWPRTLPPAAPSEAAQAAPEARASWESLPPMVRRKLEREAARAGDGAEDDTGSTEAPAEAPPDAPAEAPPDAPPDAPAGAPADAPGADGAPR